MEESRMQSTSFKDPLDEVTEHFAPEKSRLLRIAESYKISLKRFASTVAKGIESSIASVRYKLMALQQFITGQISVLSQELEEQRAHERTLKNALQNQQHGVMKVTLYLTVYILLLMSSFLLFSTTWAVIQPELPWWLGPVSSVVMIAPSILICHAYLRSPSKDRFLRYLHVIGLIAVLLTGIGVAISKSLFYTMMARSSSASFLSNASSGSTLDTVQLVASSITFCALVITEAAFGGRLAILIYEARETQQPIDKMKELLEEISSKREKLEAELQQLNTHREAIENFDDIAAKFKGATLEAMLLEADGAQRRLAGTAQNLANGFIEEESYEDLYSLTGAERNKGDNDD